MVPKGFTGIWKMLGNYRELVAIERAAYELTLPGKVDSMEEASLSLGVHDDQAEANT
jgi:hypothetical protein